MKLSQESENLIKHIQETINEQNNISEKRTAYEKKLFIQAYKDLITEIVKHAGKHFLLEVKGSYQEPGLVYSNRSVIGYVPQGKRFDFHKIFIGTLLKPQTENDYRENVLPYEEMKLLTSVAYELDLGFAGSKTIIENREVFLQKKKDAVPWLIQDILSNYFPKEWEKTNPFFQKDSLAVDLRLGDNQIKDWLAVRSTSAVSVEMKKDIGKILDYAF